MNAATKYFVNYRRSPDDLARTAGPYETSEEAEQHRRDIAGHEGVWEAKVSKRPTVVRICHHDKCDLAAILTVGSSGYCAAHGRCDHDGCELPGTTHRIDAPFCAEHAAALDARTGQHAVHFVSLPKAAGREALKPQPHHTLTSRIREAGDAELETLIAFFDAPRLREYYTGLLHDARIELARRAAATK